MSLSGRWKVATVQFTNSHSCPSIIVHTPANTHKHEQTQLCLGIPVWRARIVDDLIVVGMNGLFETKKKSIWKKAFPISQKSFGMRNIKPSRHWTQSECLWWISCHCHPDSRWPAAPPNLHLCTQKFLSLNNGGQLEEKAAAEEVVTISVLVSVSPTLIFIWAQILCGPAYTWY